MAMNMSFEVFKDADPNDKSRFGILAHVSPSVREQAFRATAGEFKQVCQVVERRLCTV